MTTRERYTKVGNYYIRRPQAYKVGPEPATWADVREAVAGLAVLLLFGVGFWLWLAIASAVQP